MAIPVVTFSTYLTNYINPRPGDYDAHDFVFAIKGRPINGYSWLKVRGKPHRFDNGNLNDVVGWWAQMVADFLNAEGPELPYVLVPFPGSKVDVRFKGTNRTTTLAEAIAAEYGHGVTVRDVLRFNQPMASASEEGGPRDPPTIYANLSLVGSVKDARIVMIDDVLTSGGHLRAGAAKLLVDGQASAVLMAICAGRADQMQVDDPLAIRREDIDEYRP